MSDSAARSDSITNPAVGPNEEKNEEGGTVLYVSNLTRNVTSEHLAEIFGIYGPMVSAEVEKDSRVGLSKGSAYVTFKRSHDMNQAMLHLDGAQIDGNVIKATFVLVSNKRRREPSAGRSSAKRRSISPPRGGQPIPRMGTGRELGRNGDDPRDGMREERFRVNDSAVSRDKAMGMRDRERRPIDERGGAGYGGRSAGVYGPSGGAGNRPRSPPRASGGDNRYGPGRGDGAGRMSDAYGPGGDARDRPGQAPSRQQGGDRGGARRRSPSPVRRRQSPSPHRGSARGSGPIKGTYQPMRRDTYRGSRDRGRERRSPSRSRDRRRSPSSSRSSSRSSRSSTSRSVGSRSSSSSRSRGNKKRPASRGRSSSASSSSRSRSREPDSNVKPKDRGEEKKEDRKGDGA